MDSIDKCYDAIMELQGVDDLKGMVSRLRKFHLNKKKLPTAKVTQPNYLWAAKRGGGISTCINAFTEYLYADKVIEFTGTAKYFEFKLAYISPDKFFSELSRLDSAMSEIAGHHRFFRGVACINIDEWTGHASDEHFYKFIDYMASRNDKILMVFCIHAEDKNVIESVESALSSRLRIETVPLRFPKSNELVELVDSKHFKSQGFYLSDDAKSLLADSIDGMIDGKHFNGFVTVEQLATDILFRLLEAGFTPSANGCEIYADMLSGFSRESKFIKRIKTFAAPKTMGFATAKEER